MIPRTFLRALDNAFYNKKKSKNGEKVPFGCAMSTEMTVPEEVLNDCSFKTTTDITSTVQKTCDDLSGMIETFFNKTLLRYIIYISSII